MTCRAKVTNAVIATGILCASAASASETIAYTYDARGRLVKVVHTGSVNNNVQTCYKYDKVDNRINVKVDIGSLPACP